MTRYRKPVPPNVAAAVAKPLEKLPADRFQSAKAFAEALGNEGFRFTALASAGTAAPAVERPTAARRLLQVAPWLLALAGIASTAWLATRSAPEPVAARFALALPDSVVVGTAAGTKVAISRDGSRIAMLGQTPGGSLALYLRRADDPVARLVRGSEQSGFGFTPRFSPDGEWLIFATAAGHAPAGLEALSSPEARLVYRLPEPDMHGRRELRLTPLELLDRLARLVPPPRIHRHRYHGVLAPNARLRSTVVSMGRPEPDESPVDAQPPPSAGPAFHSVAPPGHAQKPAPTGPLAATPRSQSSRMLWA